METIIENARVVLVDSVVEGAVRLSDGRIAALDANAAGSEVERIDAEGDFLIPGAIDLHGDDIEFEIGSLGPRASARRMPVVVGLLQSDKNAAGWGVTTKLHAIAYFEDEAKGRSRRLSGEIMDLVRQFQRDGNLLVEHWIDLRYEVTADPDYTLEAMTHPMVRMVSIMDHTPGEGQFKDIEAYKALNRTLTTADDAELERLAAEKFARQGLKHDHQRRVAQRALELGLIVASHDDNSVEKVEQMHAIGARLAEMPVRLEAAKRARELGWKISMAGPNILRGGSASGNLNAVDALAAGAMDCLCSDYYLPSLIGGAFRLFEDGHADLPTAIRLISAGPANALGLADRGVIAPGQRADLALVSTRLGHPVVRRTLRAGRTVYEDRRFAAA